VLDSEDAIAGNRRASRDTVVTRVCTPENWAVFPPM